MPDTRILVFEPFWVDLDNEQLWRGKDVLQLTYKDFSVLRYLVEHPKQLVTRKALLEAVWPETHVVEAVLTVCIHELRQALGDSPRTPQFIQTVRGRGYRFLVPVTVVDKPPARHEADPFASRTPAPSLRRSPSTVHRSVPLVDREAELAQLYQWFATALRGERQIVFIAGEAGIGKTTLVEALVAQLGTEEALWIGRGQCIDQYGAGEAYLPILEALGRLARAPEGTRLVEILRQQAPSWLVQMPALVPEAERDVLQRTASATTRERMLRELAEAVETLTAERPLVLVLEDLHWSDPSTLAWLAYAARRPDQARLLVLGTYRPVETIVRDNSVRTMTRELLRHGQCAELVLDYLSEEGVAAYLAHRCGGHALPRELARLIHQRTNGNPLFMINVVDDAVRRGMLQEGPEGWELPSGIAAVTLGVPESLRQLIEQHFKQASPKEQEVLAAASVAGSEFFVAAVATGVDQGTEDVEAQCADLARREQFLQARGMEIWPDGTVAGRYRFIHPFHQEVLYDRVPVGRRARLHRQIGIRREAGYGARARELAAELAGHFAHGQDYPRAVYYFQRAAENALQLQAPQEAVTLLTKGLDVLRDLPEGRERLQHELALRLALRSPLMTTKGYAAAELEQCLGRARELCQHVGETQQLPGVLVGLWTVYFTRAEYQQAQELEQHFEHLAQRTQTPTLLSWSHLARGFTLSQLGDLLHAREHFEQGLTWYAAHQRHAQPSPSGQDPGVAGLSYMALILWSLGYPEQALRRSQEALTLAHKLSHPYSLAYALCLAARLQYTLRQGQVAQDQAEEAITLATEQGFPHWRALGTILRGWALAVQGQPEEGVAHMRQGVDGFRATGAQVAQPQWLAMLAEGYRANGQAEHGLCVLEKALSLTDRHGERWWEAELHRLKGELLLSHTLDNHTDAEACFHQALAIAHRQHAKSLELRATLSLGQLWQRQGKKAAARQLLAEVYGWFTEGFDTADLQEATVLLDALT